MKRYNSILMQGYLDSVKAEILSIPAMASCRNTEQLEKLCDIYALGNIKDGYFASPAIEQDYVNAGMNLLDEWFAERCAMQYFIEFPDYDAELPVLQGFEDSSWHNDVCPSLLNDAKGLVVFCDYADAERRECGGYQFTLSQFDEAHDILTPLFSSDSIAQIRLAISKVSP